MTTINLRAQLQLCQKTQPCVLKSCSCCKCLSKLPRCRKMYTCAKPIVAPYGSTKKYSSWWGVNLLHQQLLPIPSGAIIRLARLVHIFNKLQLRVRKPFFFYAHVERYLDIEMLKVWLHLEQCLLQWNTSPGHAAMLIIQDRIEMKQTEKFLKFYFSWREKNQTTCSLLHIICAPLNKN